MYYHYQPHYYPMPYNQTAYQPVVHTPIANPSPNPVHQTFPNTNFTRQAPNYSRYVAQRNGELAPQNPNPQPTNRSPFPPVNPDLLYESAKESNKLMKEASMVLDKLASSKEFDAQLMDVAQRSNKEEVERLIRSIGITSVVAIHYKPDGLQLEFSSKVKEVDCCKLNVSLRWR